ncbi:hypothetical protein [Catenuloplanes indicus]|uniref:Uncharacterized protein n=1 Tax=Catenuloplanes indicus TaxID=137267 RepID=A0AAE3W6G7_9ACTN|nr:hypothetical protein [Catenuloplanes indicus]MDQ0370491.1 hypothetical protein [Catenuloplanes indicus]
MPESTWLCSVDAKMPVSTWLNATGAAVTRVFRIVSKRCRSSTGLNWLDSSVTVPSPPPPLVEAPAQAVSSGAAATPAPSASTLRRSMVNLLRA